MGSPGPAGAGIDVDMATPPRRIELMSADAALFFHKAIDLSHIGTAHFEIHGAAGLVIGAAGAADPPVVPGAAPGRECHYIPIAICNAAQNALQFPWDAPRGFGVDHFALANDPIQSRQARTGRQGQR